MHWFRGLVGLLLDLVLPRACAGCGRSGIEALCAACVPADPPIRAAADAVAAAVYAGAIRAALLRYKERGRRDLARPLGRLLARAVVGVLAGIPQAERLAAIPQAGPVAGTPQAEGLAVTPLAGVGSGVPPPRPALLVPVPSARSVAAARGGDHVRRLARHAAGELGLPLAPVLRVARASRDSAGLSRAERARERDHSMAARPPEAAEAGRVVVLVDDIVTTGATLREATRALRAAGWLVAGSATVAATPSIRHDTRSHHWQGSGERSSVSPTTS